MNLEEIKGFEIIEDLIFEKEIECTGLNMPVNVIKLPVTVNPGVIFVNSSDNKLNFNPQGIISPKEKINISEERLTYLSERGQIKLLTCL
jgi:hypothetical protein